MTSWVMKFSGFAALVVAVGCSSTLPPDRIAEPRASIRAASEMGAEKNPDAKKHLQLAQEQVARADALLKDGHKDEANWLLLRADADAELALTLAKEDKMKNELKETQTKIQDLRQRTATP